MDDFDLSGGGAAASPPSPALSDLTIAFSLLYYLAVFVLVLGLAVQTFALLRQLRRTPPALGSGSLIGRLFRAGTDVLLLRTTFFADRWAWIFGAAFHFGLALVLLRHLRYVADPSWLGPLWKLVELVQPFGFYGGLFLPLGAGGWWLRQMVLRKGRIVEDWADHAVMALLIAIPLAGYINTVIHTDVVAVKAWAVGLILLHWQNLPPDPVLLVHLWLVAMLLMLLPFSRLLLLLPLGHMLHVTSVPSPGMGRGRAKVVYAVGPALIAVLLAPVAVAARHGITQGFHAPSADFASLVADHRSDDPTVMIRNHPRFLFSHRSQVVRQGVNTPGDNLERCVTCHAVKDAAGQPVGFDDPRHFCRGCHTKAAVTIDCFECHTSKPSPERQAALPSPHLTPANAAFADRSTQP